MSKVINSFFIAEKNFGDYLNIPLIKFLSGYDLKTIHPSRSRITCIGSLLEAYQKKSDSKWKIFRSLWLKPAVLIWGTGFIIEPIKDRTLYRRLDVRAVRGYHSLERLKKMPCVKISPDVAVGDPGLLCSLLYNEPVIKKYRLGIIPHYMDKNNPLLENFKVENATVIDIEQDTFSFLQKVLECETIVSSSLHGLITADSYGIPNARMIMSDKVSGGDFKFNDYYSVFNITDHKKIFLSENQVTEATLAEIVRDYSISKEQVQTICKNLLRTFPLSLKEELKKYL